MKELKHGLENMHVGDLVRLTSVTLEVAGYVAYLSPRKVRLSHENPFGVNSHDTHIVQRRGLLAGDRTYLLKHFDEYEIVRSIGKVE